METVIKEMRKEHKGKIYKFVFGVLAKNVETDDGHQFLTKQEKENIVLKGSPIDNKVQFTKATTRENIISSETIPKMMGKICKVISDLMEAGTGFRNVTDAVNQGTETDVVSRKALKGVDDKLGGVSFEREGNNVYAVYKNGADTVRKKLGNNIFGQANALAHILYLENSINLQVTEFPGQENQYTRYGSMSIFDLTIFPGYSDFVFGEDIMAMACLISSPQDGVNYDVMLLPHKKLQHNIDAPIGNDVTVRDFGDNPWGPGTYAPQFDPADGEDYYKSNSIADKKTVANQYMGDSNYLKNMVLYCPQNGRLYCTCFNTCTIIAVSLYRM